MSLRAITHFSCSLAGELSALALLVGKQVGSLGLRSTLAPWLMRWSRERHRLGHGLYDLGVAASVASRQHALDHLDSGFELLITQRLDAPAMLDFISRGTSKAQPLSTPPATRAELA